MHHDVSFDYKEKGVHLKKNESTEYQTKDETVSFFFVCLLNNSQQVTDSIGYSSLIQPSFPLITIFIPTPLITDIPMWG